MVDHLEAAFNSNDGELGNGVQSMFDIRMAAINAFQVPLSNGKVAGPSFVYIPVSERAGVSNQSNGVQS